MRRPRAPAARRRGADLVEDVVAGLLGVPAILGCGIALFVGLAVSTAALQQSRTEVATRTPVVATVAVEAGSPLLGGRGIPRLRALATVTWTAPDGTPAADTVIVPPGTVAGTAVAIWVPRDGAVTSPTRSPANAIGAGLASGLAVLLVDVGLISGAWWATRRVTLAINA